MKKKFNVQDILDFNPCSEYTEERITKLFKSVGCKKYITVDELFKANIPHQDFFWLILRPEFIPERQLHEISIWCAEKIALPIWNKYYPDDKRPQEAIRIKKLWLKGKATIGELTAARDVAGTAAGDAVGTVAGTAVAAVRAAVGAAEQHYGDWELARAAARDVARAAARDAVGTAARDVARDVAGDVARAAVWAAAREKIKKQIKKVIENGTI